eukprot:1998593-Prymnesium_polylepis.1
MVGQLETALARGPPPPSGAASVFENTSLVPLSQVDLGLYAGEPWEVFGVAGYTDAIQRYRDEHLQPLLIEHGRGSRK